MKNVKSGHAQPVVCLDAGHFGKYNRSPVVPDYYETDTADLAEALDMILSGVVE